VIGVLGAGPHGHELANVLVDGGANVAFFDDHLGHYSPVDVWTGPFVIGAAWPRVRRQIAGRARGVAHRGGIVLFPGSVVSRDAVVGPHTHVGYNAVVSHGCRVGSFVNVCAGVVLGGEVTVEDDVFIGSNATVIHGGLTIGKGSTIGAGAVVISDVAPGDVVAGVPARSTVPAKAWQR
jgi:acetyltransferase-like isoleucine patch superfamily enzyme